MNYSFSSSIIRLFLVSATTGGRVPALTPCPSASGMLRDPEFSSTFFVEMPAGEGI